MHQTGLGLSLNTHAIMDKLGHTLLAAVEAAGALLIKAAEIAGKALVKTVDMIGDYITHGGLGMTLAAVGGALGAVHLNPLKWSFTTQTPDRSPFDNQFQPVRERTQDMNKVIEMPRGQTSKNLGAADGTPKLGGRTTAKMPDTAMASQNQAFASMLKVGGFQSPSAGFKVMNMEGGLEDNYTMPKLNPGKVMAQMQGMKLQRSMAMAA